MINLSSNKINSIIGVAPKFRAADNPQSKVNSVQSNNLIVRYLDYLAAQNINHWDKFTEPQYSTPFANNPDVKVFDEVVGKYVDNNKFKNIKVCDSKGNVVQSVEYKKEGNKIIQTIFVKCINGNTVNKVITLDGNKTTMNFVFKNSAGKPIIEENRTYEKLDNDTAISTHNGKTYKISGLSGDVITVEHNGQKTTVNLADKIQENMESIDQKILDKKVNNEQKEILKNHVKTLSGDLILKFNEEIKSLVWLDDDDCFFNKNGSKLKMSQNFGSLTFLHELGHAINCEDSKCTEDSNIRWSDDKYYTDVRNFEIKNFKLHNNDDETDEIMQKFTECNYFVREGIKSPAEAKKDGADEEFAELHEFINDINIVEGAPGYYRPMLLLQYMPYSTQIAYNKMKSLY